MWAQCEHEALLHVTCEGIKFILESKELKTAHGAIVV